MPRSAKNAPAAPDLPDHVVQSVADLAEFHRGHYQAASRRQRAIDWVVRRLGRPSVAIGLLAGLLAWMAATIVITDGRVDHPAFAWLEFAATLGALGVALLILVSETRAAELAERREQLTLELALLADKKTAKLIALMEELRRDAPGLADRSDPESAEMARPADPQAVLDEIDRKAPREQAKEG